MFSVEAERVIPAIERPQTHASDRTTTEIGTEVTYNSNILMYAKLLDIYIYIIKQDWHMEEMTVICQQLVWRRRPRTRI
jgi:hypothetical protein